MVWVEDYEERLVNIDRWDILDFRTINDKQTNETAAIKIYLQRDDEIYLLGYRSSDDRGENIIELISKGVKVHLNSLNTVLLYYLRKEFDEKFGNCDFDLKNQKCYKEFKKIINDRFEED